MHSRHAQLTRCFSAVAELLVIFWCTFDLFLYLLYEVIINICLDKHYRLDTISVMARNGCSECEALCASGSGVTDRRTGDSILAYARYSIMLSRAKSLRLRRFKSNSDEIWQDCSSVTNAAVGFLMTSYVHDGGHDAGR